MLRDFLFRIIEPRETTSPSEPLEYSSDNLRNELEDLAMIDGVTIDDEIEHAILFYTFARKLTNQGYSPNNDSMVAGLKQNYKGLQIKTFAKKPNPNSE